MWIYWVCGMKVRCVTTTGKIAVPRLTVEGYILKNFTIRESIK